MRETQTFFSEKMKDLSGMNIRVSYAMGLVIKYQR